MKNFKLSFSDKSIISFAGTIRGAIGFGLALGIESENPKYTEVLVSSTLSLVISTTFFFGAIMPFFISIMQPKEEVLEASKNLIEVQHESREGESNLKVRKERLSYWILRYWKEFDEAYFRPSFINHYDVIKNEHKFLVDKMEDALKEAEAKFENPNII